jgi:hypothetical protein
LSDERWWFQALVIMWCCDCGVAIGEDDLRDR